jgi:hypothetical protein
MAITYSGGITIAGGLTQTVLGVGGSTSYDGTTQYLTLPNSSAAVDISTGDFTVECWFNTNSISNGGLGQTLLYLGGNTSSYATVRLGLDTTGLHFYVSVDGIQYSINSGIIGTVVSNTWNHVAVTRATDTFKVYLNGVQVGVNYTQAGTLYLGTLNYIGALNYAAIVTNPYRLMNGYISNVRVVKGVVVYTGTFSVPTKPLTAIQSANTNGNPSTAITSTTSTGVLLNMSNNSSFLQDSSTNNLTVTNVAGVASSSLTPFNPGSVLFNGTTQYLTVPTNAAFSFGTGDFTVEAWANFSSVAASQYIVDFRLDSADGSNQAPALAYQSSSGKILYISGSAVNITGTTTIAANTWYHVALVRSSGTTKLYVNGILNGTFADSGSYTNFTNRPIIGAFATGTANFLGGYISNLRVVKGVAVYTAAFTPPTGPLTSTQTANQNGNPSAAITGTSTSLLLNTQNGPAYINDSSTNNFTITNTGSATTQSSIPFSL